MVGVWPVHFHVYQPCTQLKLLGLWNSNFRCDFDRYLSYFCYNGFSNDSWSITLVCASDVMVNYKVPGFFFAGDIWDIPTVFASGMRFRI